MAVTPPKMQIWNVEQATILEVQFNPKTLPEKLKAVWNAHVVPGMSHPIKQYSHTGPHEHTVDLLWAVRTVDDQKKYDEARRFILSLMYPWRGKTSPPRALLVWPSTVSMTVTIDDLDGGHLWFDDEMRTRWWTCKLAVSEIRDARLYGDDVLRNGTQRTTGSKVT